MAVVVPTSRTPPAWARWSASWRWRRHGERRGGRTGAPTAPDISRVSVALLLLAGSHVVAWYGWFELWVVDGTTPGDSVVEAATDRPPNVAGAVARDRWNASPLPPLTWGCRGGCR